MKDFRKKLLSLLKICAEDRDESGKLLYLEKVIHSEDYQELVNNQAFCTEYQSEWTIAQLERLSFAELQKKESEIHHLGKMLRLLQKAICYGNAPSLTTDDFCSFKNPLLIAKLNDKLSVGKALRNYTNIDSRNMMKIFDPATVKSAKECFSMIPILVAQKTDISKTDIQTAMGSRLYCVDIEEFNRIHRDFLIFSDNANTVIGNEKQRRRKHRLFKMGVVMTLFGITFACDQFGLFSEAYVSTFSVIMFFNSLLYIILG
jgi:hypothetical protein